MTIFSKVYFLFSLALIICHTKQIRKKEKSIHSCLLSCQSSVLAAASLLTLEARLSFFMACIIPRLPWQPEASLRPGPAAGELSCDTASELGMMLRLSEAEALSRMLGSGPFRQLSVFRLLCSGGGFSSVPGKKTEKIQGSVGFEGKKGETMHSIQKLITGINNSVTKKLDVCLTAGVTI